MIIGFIVCASFDPSTTLALSTRCFFISLSLSPMFIHSNLLSLMKITIISLSRFPCNSYFIRCYCRWCNGEVAIAQCVTLISLLLKSIFNSQPPSHSTFQLQHFHVHVSVCWYLRVSHFPSLSLPLFSNVNVNPHTVVVYNRFSIFPSLCLVRAHSLLLKAIIFTVELLFAARSWGKIK